MAGRMSAVRWREVETLALWLLPGDIARVASTVWKPRSQSGRYSVAYVGLVARGYRSNDRIWAALWKVANENRRMMEEMENSKGEIMNEKLI